MKRYASLLQVPYSENVIALIFYYLFCFTLLFGYSRIVEIIFFLFLAPKTWSLAPFQEKSCEHIHNVKTHLSTGIFNVIFLLVTSQKTCKKHALP